MTVLIYQDYIHNNGLLYRSLCRQYGEDKVRYCDASEIIEGILTSDISLFVMPGGADLYKCEKLNGPGNEQIRAYVEQGGNFLGICSGAYYGCKGLKWAEEHEDHMIIGTRELGFFPGLAIGPVYDFIEDRDICKSWEGAAPIAYDDGSYFETVVSYGGGPVFKPEGQSGYKVLARYHNLPDAPAAIVECKIEKGKAILSSPHIERTASDLKRSLYHHQNTSHQWHQNIIARLEPHENDARKLWHHILNRF